MKIAIATDNGNVSPHFGRCSLFTVVEVQDGKVVNREELMNPGHSPGMIPQFLQIKGAQHIVCGGIGMHAEEIFKDIGIGVTTGVEGPIDEAIGKLVRGELKGGPSLCQPGAGRGTGVEKDECDHAHDKTSS